MARTKNRYRSPLETDEHLISHAYLTGIYIRLSKERTEAWRNKSQSMETQESLARDFAKQHGLTVVKCYTDYEYSGTNFKRPAFQEMMEDIKKGIINCILIRDLSRLGRNYIEMGRLIDKVFPFLGVRFISINDNLDTISGLENKKSFEVEIKNLVNDLYAKDISKKVTAYNKYQASQGYFLGNRPPYGYQLDKQEQGIKLVIDPIVKPILTRVFEKLQEGKSIIEVTNYLNRKKLAIPTSYRQTGQLYKKDDDTKEWKSANLLRLVKSPIYQGHLVQLKTNKNLSEKDYICFENAHEAYISQKQYEVILALLHQRRSSRKSTIPKTPNRYQGLVYAKTKSTQMYRKCRHFSNNKSDYDYYYFMDVIQGRDKTEKQTVYISEQALDRVILEIFQSEMKRLAPFEKLSPRLEDKKKTCLQTYQNKIINHKKTVTRLQCELNDLYTTYSLHRKEREAYLIKKTEITVKIETILQEIAQYENVLKQIEMEYQKQMVWLESLFKCQKQTALTAELLTALIDRIEVDVDKTVAITFTCQIGGITYD